MLVVGYRFDLQTNHLSAERIPNPNVGKEHRFVAYRLINQSAKEVSMALPVSTEISTDIGAENE